MEDSRAKAKASQYRPTTLFAGSCDKVHVRPLQLAFGTFFQVLVLRHQCSAVGSKPLSCLIVAAVADSRRERETEQNAFVRTGSQGRGLRSLVLLQVQLARASICCEFMAVVPHDSFAASTWDMFCSIADPISPPGSPRPPTPPSPSPDVASRHTCQMPKVFSTFVFRKVAADCVQSDARVGYSASSLTCPCGHYWKRWPRKWCAAIFARVTWLGCSTTRSSVTVVLFSARRLYVRLTPLPSVHWQQREGTRKRFKRKRNEDVYTAEENGDSDEAVVGEDTQRERAREYCAEDVSVSATSETITLI